MIALVDNSNDKVLKVLDRRDNLWKILLFKSIVDLNDFIKIYSYRLSNEIPLLNISNINIDNLKDNDYIIYTFSFMPILSKFEVR